jgi:hypothetical protein
MNLPPGNAHRAFCFCSGLKTTEPWRTKEKHRENIGGDLGLGNPRRIEYHDGAEMFFNDNLYQI